MNWKNQFVEMLFPLNASEMKLEGAFLLKYQNLPQFIYKYREVNENSKKNLRDGTIWMADPRTMNDPYDCALLIDISKMNNALFKNPPKKLIDKLPPAMIAAGLLDALKMSDNPNETLVDFMFSSEPPGQRGEMKKALNIAINQVQDDMIRANSDRIKESFKLCSFSERVDSTLMWAHYAKYHKGFCIEYNVKEIRGDDPRSRLLFPVIYSEEIFDATSHASRGVNSPEFNNLYLNYAGLHKAIDWAYEKEWRLLFPHGIMKSPQACLMPKPSAVYLGSHIEPEAQKEIIDICAQIEVRVLKMQHSPRKYKMVATTLEQADRKRFG